MQTINSDSFNVTSLLGSQLGLATILPVSYPVQREFTLNNHLNIVPNQDFSETPKLRYFGVGINGCYNVDDGNLVAAYNPSRTDMNLYNLVPIRCVPMENDLSAVERKKYRLRQLKTMPDGNQYYLYYLKVLEWSNDITYAQINSTDNTEIPYELDPSNLSPKPSKPDSNSFTISSTSSIIAYYQANLTLTSDELLEYISLKYNGDTRYSRVSEIGFFTGVDTEVSSSANTTPITYTEAVYTQLYNHLTISGIPLTKSGMKINAPFRITSTGIITSV